MKGSRVSGAADAAQGEGAAADDFRPARAEGREFHEPVARACAFSFSLIDCFQLTRHVWKELGPRCDVAFIFSCGAQNLLARDSGFAEIAVCHVHSMRKVN